MARISLSVATFLALAGVQPAAADVAEAVNDAIIPAYDRLATATKDMARAAAADCSPDALRPHFDAVWDAWSHIDFVHLGPVETDGRALAMSFWPDAKGSGKRAQQALIAGDGKMIDDPDAFGRLSVGLRGLAGMERLIYPSDLTGDEAVMCRMRRATATDLARMAGDIRAEWTDYAGLLLKPGAGGNTTFLTPEEARQAIYTQVMTGLTYLADVRLGRPLGTFEKPRPERAEAVAAGRGLANIAQSLEGIREVALALYPDAPQTVAAFDRAQKLVADLDDPALAGVAEPQSRLKVEIIQQAVQAIPAAIEGEIGAKLGLSVGFNAKDGD